VTVTLEIEPLGPRHDRTKFTCGVVALDRYFQLFVTQDTKRRISNCFVAVTADGDIAGFYTLAATSLRMGELTPDEAKRLPRYPLLPAGLIGRLAVDQRYAGKRIGSALVMDAVARSARSDPAIFALVVDAKDDRAAQFYEHLGFRRFASRPASLFLPVATALAALQSATR